ncbi:MAG: two-component sensor histidine kinase [Planctomycetaceae bacterium]|nr:two-component sensor histidine kinase [Planctomycetaceae bacterium]
MNPVASDFHEQERDRLRKQYSEIATLAGGLAHEIRNPLSTIRLNLNLLCEELEHGESPRDRRMLNKLVTIQRECRHLEGILDAFLQFARVGELRLLPADLNEIIKEFIDFVRPEATERGIDLSLHLDADLPPVRLDEALIRQLLMNLIRNAEQAMPEGGLIELQTAPDADFVKLSLIDNGVGMDERTRSRMFQAFYSTRAGGSGLGLPTVRKIVEAHRGSIECQSEPGRGTQFSIRLPIAASTADAAGDIDADDSEE